MNKLVNKARRVIRAQTAGSPRHIATTSPDKWVRVFSSCENMPTLIARCESKNDARAIALLTQDLMEGLLTLAEAVSDWRDAEAFDSPTPEMEEMSDALDWIESELSKALGALE